MPTVDGKKYAYTDEGKKQAKKAMNAKYGKKNSNYKAGTPVPAIEESLYKKDDIA